MRSTSTQRLAMAHRVRRGKSVQRGAWVALGVGNYGLGGGFDRFQDFRNLGMGQATQDPADLRAAESYANQATVYPYIPRDAVEQGKAGVWGALTRRLAILARDSLKQVEQFLWRC